MTAAPKRKPAERPVTAWQTVELSLSTHTQRMPIAGGYLYLHIYDTAIDDGGQQRCMVFVPDPPD